MPQTAPQNQPQNRPADVAPADSVGAMARRLGGDKELWLSAVERCVPPKFLEMNKKAFELGWNA